MPRLDHETATLPPWAKSLAATSVADRHPGSGTVFARLIAHASSSYREYTSAPPPTPGAPTRPSSWRDAMTTNSQPEQVNARRGWWCWVTSTAGADHAVIDDEMDMGIARGDGRFPTACNRTICVAPMITGPVATCRRCIEAVESRQLTAPQNRYGVVAR